jgi:2-(3-amino-3-carboxypropyl)histidine synthase
MNYEIDIDKMVERIDKVKAKRVLLQLPDGLKPRALEIASALKERTSAEILIWAGSNFGGCDYPFYVDSQGVDLIINVGHAEFPVKNG